MLHISSVAVEDAQNMMEWFNTFVEQDLGVVEDTKVTLEQEKSYLKSCVEQLNNNKLLSIVGRFDQKIVGKVDVRRLPRHVDNHVGEVSFGILREYAQEGVNLIDYISLRAKESNYSVLVYYILDCNQLFIDIFEKAGFRKAGVIRNFYKTPKGQFDRVIFDKIL